MPIDSQSMRCGYIAIIGQPNVGKSTLLNRILGQKISITCRKPQTTRHQVLGVKTVDHIQYLYVDTPGLHQMQPKAINRYMNRAASSVVQDVDVVVMLLDGKWSEQDDWVLSQLKGVSCPVILVLNKVDRVKHKQDLLPIIAHCQQRYNFAHILPISAKQGDQVDQLEQLIGQYLPQHPFIFDEDQVTDRSMRFLASEIIREKLMRLLGQELPYAVTVEIEQFQETDKLFRISASILVERNTQKAMIIGKQGQKLKEIGQQARLDMEKQFDIKVFLQLWVKVKSGWADDERGLRSLGYFSD